MKRFRFRLEALLKQREQIEKDRQKELAEAVRQVQEQKTRLDAIHLKNRDTLDRKREQQAGTMRVSDLQIYSRYLHRLKRDSLGAEELLKALRKTEARRRDALLEAAKNRKIYETLIDHQQDDFYREAAQAAAKENDEVGLSIFRANCAKSS